MRKLSVVFLSIIFVATSHLAHAQPTPDSGLIAKAEALIEPIVKADQFSGSILVARNGVPLFRQSFGLANREWDVPNTPDTKFRIGSITKEFTATAILQLAEGGKLSIDDPVSKYYVEAPPAWKDITIKHLLTHTSGIPSYTAIPHFFAADARLDRKPEEIIKLTQDKPLEFAPGSKFSYDNSGYIILGYIIEKVSGENYADYVQHHIFDPLGMKSTGYDVSETIIPKRASGYDWAKTKLINTPYLSMTEPYSAGSLYSTVDDMLLWDQALYSGKLLSPHSYQEMFTDYGHGYGFGWVIDNQFGHQHIWHNGGINGFISRLDRYPHDKLTVIVLSNQTNAPINRIAAGFAAIYLDIPPRSATAGGDTLLRNTIQALRAGTPNYDQMSTQLADVTRAQLPNLQKVIGNLGDVMSIVLLAAEPDGTDRYKVVFQNGATEWGIKVSADGKLTAAGFHPIP